MNDIVLSLKYLVFVVCIGRNHLLCELQKFLYVFGYNRFLNENRGTLNQKYLITPALTQDKREHRQLPTAAKTLQIQ